MRRPSTRCITHKVFGRDFRGPAAQWHDIDMQGRHDGTHKDGADLRLCVGGTQCCVISAKISHARAQYCCSFLHAGLPPFVCAATARRPPHMLFRECSISTHVTDHTRAEYGCSLAHRRCDSRPRRRRLSVARAGRMSMGLDGGLNEKIASAEPTGGGPWSARELSRLDCARKFIQMLHPSCGLT